MRLPWCPLASAALIETAARADSGIKFVIALWTFSRSSVEWAIVLKETPVIILSQAPEIKKGVRRKIGYAL
jgi:hypothetical protein